MAHVTGQHEQESPAAAHPATGPDVDRRGAVAAGSAILAGALTMLMSLVAVPGPWLAGYVSEAGTGGLPFATPYRVGLLLLAAGVGLLGHTLRRRSHLVAVLLGGAAAFASVSGVVPCTDGCPLPPFEPTTAGDVVHAAASVLGMVVLAGAMALVALSPVFDRAARRLAAVATTLIVPLGGALGLIMLLIGRGSLGAALERLALAVAVGWLIGTALLTAWRGAGRGPRPAAGG